TQKRIFYLRTVFAPIIYRLLYRKIVSLLCACGGSYQQQHRAAPFNYCVFHPIYFLSVGFYILESAFVLLALPGHVKKVPATAAQCAPSACGWLETPLGQRPT